MGPDSHSEISRLVDDIKAHGGSFADSPTASSQATPMAEAPKSTDAACHPAPTDTCSDSCKLSDSICDDAKKICDLAATLPGDTWAAGKCDSGKTSCSDAHDKCCACRLGAPQASHFAEQARSARRPTSTRSAALHPSAAKPRAGLLVDDPEVCLDFCLRGLLRPALRGTAGSWS